MSTSGVVLSVDAGQKGGPLNSFSVIQAWSPCGGKHLLLEQWREQARYPDFRDAFRRMLRRHHPSAVLIEDTNQGSSLLAEIRPRPGMSVHPITPSGDKVERARAQQAVIRSGGVQLPADAVWRESFVAEWRLFPCAGYDDQVDATVQYLEWISRNPAPAKREQGGIAARVDRRGQPLYGLGNLTDSVGHGVAVSLHSRRRWW